MDAFQMELVRRLPLAQATLGLMDFAIDDEFLAQLFQDHRGRCYDRDLKFPALMHMVRDALLIYDGSGRKSIQQARDNQQIDVHQSSVYRKLKNVPEALSQAMLLKGTKRLEEITASQARQLPSCVSSMKVVAIDGKELKRISKRLLPARAFTSGSLLGGKLLVALCLRSDLALAMSCTPEGESNDVPLVPALVEQVRQRIEQSILWIADRQFTDLKLFALLGAREDHFLIRLRRGIGFEEDPSRPQLEQQDAQGRRVVQQWGWLGSVNNEHRRYVRRITLYRAEEDDLTDDVTLATDLLDETTHPGLQLLEVYLQRWGIERCFQQVTEVFGLQKFIGSTPRAAIFQSAFCFLIYNLAQVIRSYVAEAGKMPMNQVSTENIFFEATRELICWNKLGDDPFMPLRAPHKVMEMKKWLKQLLAGCWQAQFIKQSDKKPRKKKKRKKLPGGHGSLWALMIKANHPHTALVRNC